MQAARTSSVAQRAWSAWIDSRAQFLDVGPVLGPGPARLVGAVKRFGLAGMCEGGGVGGWVVGEVMVAGRRYQDLLPCLKWSKILLGAIGCLVGVGWG